jgi:hypothetical protein
MVVVAVIVSMTSIKLSEKGFLFAPTTPSNGGGGGGGGGNTSSGVVVYTTKQIDEQLAHANGLLNIFSYEHLSIFLQNN